MGAHGRQRYPRFRLWKVLTAMGSFPMLPLFTDAFLADTGHLSGQETGAYLLLIMMAWRQPECRIPDDDDKLARWSRVDKRTWTRIKPTVMEFWTLADGFWTQGRLRREWEFVSRRAEANRENGALGGRARAGKLPVERSKDAALNSKDALHGRASKPLETNDPVKRGLQRNGSESLPSLPIPIASPNGEAAREAKGDPKAVPAFIDRMLRQFPDLNAAAASGGLLVPTEINLWVAKGFDLELDIEPAVVGYLSRPNRRAPRSWSFFAAIVVEYRDKRLSMPAAAAAAPSQTKKFTRLNPDGSIKPDRDGKVWLIRDHYTGGGFKEFEPDNYMEERYLIGQVRQFHEDGTWDRERLGPPPGDPLCLMTDRVLAGAALPVPEQLNGTGSTARH